MIGTGILKGMAVTARNFVGSYFEKDRLITVQYPEERETLPENYRNFPFLIYDGDDTHAGLRCVAVATSYGREELSAAELVVGSLGELTVPALDRLCAQPRESESTVGE